MGLDVYIQARIRKKTDNFAVSVSERKMYEKYGKSWMKNPDNECFEICYWRKCYDIRDALIEIVQKHGGKSLDKEDPDAIFSVPMEAFPEIYAYLLSRSLLPAGEEPDSIWSRLDYEWLNLTNAEKILNILRFFSEGGRNYPKLAAKPEHFITEAEFEAFCQNPEEYNWSFELINSY